MEAVARTFARRGPSRDHQTLAAKSTSPVKPANARSNVDSLGGVLNPSDPFFFGNEAQQGDPQERAPRTSGRAGAAKSPTSKAGPGGGSRPVGKAAAAGIAPSPGSKAPINARKSGGAAVAHPGDQAQAAAGTGKGGCKAAAPAAAAVPAQPNHRAPIQATAPLLPHRNSGIGKKQKQEQQQQQQQQRNGSAEAPPAATAERKLPSGPARPSARSQPSAQQAPKQGQQAGKSSPAAAARAAAAAAGGSQGKRKAVAAPGAAPTTAPAAATASPNSKRMKRSEGNEPAGPGGGPRAPAAAAPAAQRAVAGRASGGASRPAPASGGGVGGAPLAALHPAALRGQAAATTVVQAQALGEQQSIEDDALWALDGLASGNAATARESLATLAEICSSRRGRLALRSGQLAADVLAAAGALDVGSDPVQALGLATLLLCFCQADADAALLGRQEVAAAAALLLKVSSTLDASSATTSAAGSAAAAKLAGILKERPYCLQLPPEERGSPLSMALVALADVLDPSKSALHADALKSGLREAGALEAAAQVAADHAAALTDAAPTMHTVRSLWRLHKALQLLESACFACPDNEARLLAASVATGVPPVVSRPGIVAWLVQQLAVLSRQALIPGIKKDCLHGLLAVLLNATQNNQAGCAAVVAAGALEPAAAVLAQIVRGGAKIRGVVAASGELAVWHDVLSTCIALFINLAEHGASWRQQLAQAWLPDPNPSATGGDGSGRVQLVPLLCSLLAVVAPAGHKPGDGTPRAAGLARRVSLGSGEVSADCLALREDRDVHSMVEVYAAVLLGFLIQDCAETRAQAAALLPGASLEGVVAAVERALDFYATMGAMTQDSVGSLRALLASLQQHTQQQQQQPALPAAPAAQAPGECGAGEEPGSPMSPVL